MQHASTIAGGAWPLDAIGSNASERAAAAFSILALVLGVATAAFDHGDVALPPFAAMAMSGSGPTQAGGRSAEGGISTARETRAGGYLGVTYTHPSDVRIDNPGRTAMTVRGVEWEGKPFKSPIYYGLRVTRWLEGGIVGGMLDFTHAKTISRFDQAVTFEGTREGKPVPPSARVGEVFKHLEFSHGHNMLTLNGLLRLGALPFVRPYAGAGAGISLPHTEIGYRDEPGRTYEYQYAGLAGQVLAGIEVPLGATSLFIEYKLSYAAYDVPLSGVVNGDLLFTDLWRQFRAWWRGEAPPGGRLRTPLVTHHGIGGVMIRVAPRPGA